MPGDVRQVPRVAASVSPRPEAGTLTITMRWRYFNGCGPPTTECSKIPHGIHTAAARPAGNRRACSTTSATPQPSVKLDFWVGPRYLETQSKQCPKTPSILLKKKERVVHSGQGEGE